MFIPVAASTTLLFYVKSERESVQDIIISMLNNAVDMNTLHSNAVCNESK